MNGIAAMTRSTDCLRAPIIVSSTLSTSPGAEATRYWVGAKRPVSSRWNTSRPRVSFTFAATPSTVTSAERSLGITAASVHFSAFPCWSNTPMSSTGGVRRVYQPSNRVSGQSTANSASVTEATSTSGLSMASPSGPTPLQVPLTETAPSSTWNPNMTIDRRA